MVEIPKEVLLELLANEKAWSNILLLLALIGSGISVLFTGLFAYWKWRSEIGHSRDTESSEKYHDLIKNLVQGDGEITYIDRQSTVVYELRFFPKYHNYSSRMLRGLLNNPKWTNARLKDEMEKTINYIRIRASIWKRFWYWISGEPY